MRSAAYTLVLILTILFAACTDVEDQTEFGGSSNTVTAAVVDSYDFNGTRTCVALSGRTLVGFETDTSVACSDASGTADEANGFSLPLLKESVPGFGMVQSSEDGVSWVFILAPPAPPMFDVQPRSASLAETKIGVKSSELYVLRIDTSACGSRCEIEVQVGTANLSLEVAGDLSSAVISTFVAF